MRSSLIRLGTALASTALLGATAVATVTTGTAGASTSGNSGPSTVPSTLSGIKAAAATDISDRIRDLNAAIAKVDSASGLGSGQAAVAAALSQDVAPLQQLGVTIQGDTTVQQAGRDFGTIFTEYRVYLLVLPASRIAADADHATATAIPKLQADAARAQAHLDPGNQATLQPLLDDLQSQIGTATNATNGLAATVLAFTPAQWNADASLLSAPRGSEPTATQALGKARGDVKQIALDLKGAATPGTTPTT